jgi:hypothetical protein
LFDFHVDERSANAEMSSSVCVRTVQCELYRFEEFREALWLEKAIKSILERQDGANLPTQGRMIDAAMG